MDDVHGRILADFEKLRSEIGFDDPSAVLPWMRNSIDREIRAAVLAERKACAAIASDGLKPDEIAAAIRARK